MWTIASTRWCRGLYGLTGGLTLWLTLWLATPFSAIHDAGVAINVKVAITLVALIGGWVFFQTISFTSVPGRSFTSAPERFARRVPGRSRWPRGLAVGLAVGLTSGLAVGLTSGLSAGLSAAVRDAGVGALAAGPSAGLFFSFRTTSVIGSHSGRKRRA